MIVGACQSSPLFPGASRHGRLHCLRACVGASSLEHWQADLHQKQQQKKRKHLIVGACQSFPRLCHGILTFIRGASSSSATWNHMYVCMSRPVRSTRVQPTPSILPLPVKISVSDGGFHGQQRAGLGSVHLAASMLFHPVVVVHMASA